MEKCRLFTLNYPLLIQHILREARLYHANIDNLMHNRHMSYKGIWGTEEFWNKIMMEHALFIRSLLDPSEEALIETADDFSQDYKKLLEISRPQNRETMRDIFFHCSLTTFYVKPIIIYTFFNVHRCSI